LLPTISKKTDHVLTVKIKLDESYGDIALNANAKVLRSQGQLRAHLVVTDSMDVAHRQSLDALTKKMDQGTVVADSKPWLDTTVESVTSYTVQDVEEFSVMSAESGARERMIKNLARDIVHELQLIAAR
jgi:hypothetical protein